MQDQPNLEGGESHDPPEGHEMVERAVLALVLSMHPARLTIFELARELSKGPKDDAVERAIRNLVGAGLLECDGPYAAPTQSALYLGRLGLAPGPPPPLKPPSPNGA
jgi:hypothetical protein